MSLVVISHKCPYFFDIDFCIQFWMYFWRNLAPNCLKNLMHLTLSFRNLFQTSMFGCILVEFWLRFTCLWSPFGSLLVLFGSLSVPLSLDFLIFGGSWRHSSYFVIFSKKILSRIIFLIKRNPIDVWPNVPLPFFRKVVSAVAETRLCRAKDNNKNKCNHNCDHYYCYYAHYY